VRDKKEYFAFLPKRNDLSKEKRLEIHDSVPLAKADKFATMALILGIVISYWVC